MTWWIKDLQPPPEEKPLLARLTKEKTRFFFMKDSTVLGIVIVHQNVELQEIFMYT